MKNPLAVSKRMFSIKALVELASGAGQFLVVLKLRACGAQSCFQDQMLDPGR